MTAALVAIMLGAAAGVLSAMFGVGGGLIFVPTLIFLGKSTHVAVATSLAAMVPVILMGSWRQTRYGNVRWREAIVVGIASVPTAKLGEVLASSLSNSNLRRLFALLLLLTAAQMAVRTLRSPAGVERDS
ncbi:MAG TPA: sulfite exporter TauE/SafE family protein [Gaiellales bacterium]|nr:sulfite exporter TauE/SafE family protein [Gaiellales bacterium]